MDSAVDNSIALHVDEYTQLKFLNCGRGLYYLNLNNNDSITDYSFLSTVADNKHYFTRREIQGADEAHLLQGRVGWPSYGDFRTYIMHNQLQYCSTTADQITAGKAIYVLLVPILQGKMVRQQPQHGANFTRVPIPLCVLKQHPNDTAIIDFLFIKKRPYLLMCYRVHKFHGVNVCRGCVKVDTSTGIKTYLTLMYSFPTSASVQLLGHRV